MAANAGASRCKESSRDAVGRSTVRAVTGSTTVNTNWTRAYADAARAWGVDVDRAMADDGIAPDALSVERIECVTDNRIWRAITSVLGDPRAGLRFGRRGIAAGDFGVVGHLAATSATLGDALAVAARHTNLRLRPTAVGAALEGAPAVRGCARPPVVPEAFLTGALELVRRWTGADISPVAATLGHPRPDHAAELEHTLGCAVGFDSRADGFEFAGETLRLPLATADAELHRVLEGVAATPALRDVLARRALVAIRRELAGGGDLLSRVSRRLGTSPRTLQRHLADRALSFRGLVDATRRERALTLLSRRQVDLAGIAAATGFSDARALRRAFLRWTGSTPRALRQRLLADAPQSRANSSSRYDRDTLSSVPSSSTAR